MSKFCPKINGPVVYLDCLECDYRVCVKGGKELAKIIKKIKQPEQEVPDKKVKKIKSSEIDEQVKEAKKNIRQKSVPVMESKYSGIIKPRNVAIPTRDLIQFIPEHIHTDYSTKDAAMSIDEYIESLKEMGFKGGTITEHGNMSSSVKFYKAMKANGLKPILGNEIYTDDNIELKIEASLERSKRKKDDEAAEGGYLDDEYGHLVVLAPTNEAYNELLLTTAKGFRDGFYKRPRVTHEWILNEASKHQITTTACLASKFNYYIRCGQDKEAKQLLSDYKSAFGDRFYAELHFNELEIQRYCTNKLLEFCKELKIPWMIGLDAHYAKKEHAEYHDYMKDMFYKGSLSKPSSLRYNTRELYLKNSNEVLHSALKWDYGIDQKDIIIGLNRTNELYDRTTFEMEMGKLRFPKFSNDPNFDPVAELKKKCIRGYNKRKKQGLLPAPGYADQDYKDRFNKEFPVIVSKGYADYFLIVSEYTDYCVQTELFKGPGRGSAAGALISWLLDITKIDPIRYGLFFERFLNEERADPPDIDLDFDSERRFEIEELLIRKNGPEKVAHIMSFGTWGCKSILGELSKVFELPWGVVDKLKKLCNDDQSLQENIDRILGIKPVKKIKKDGTVQEIFEIPSPDIKEFIENNEKFFTVCKFFEGKVRNYSMHASGVVVTPGPMEELAPINRASGQIVTGLQEGGDIREISDIGLLKFDILGLNNCTIVNRTLKSIKRRKGITIDIDAIDLEDDNLLERFRKGHTTGIFQFESTGITKFMKDIQPQRLEDLIIVNAAYRPGTLRAGGVDAIIENRHSDNIDYMHPAIEEVLGPTYNVLVYQEQQMALMAQVGGFTMVEADKSRKTIKLINKASTASPEQLKKFYDMIEHFKQGAHEKTGLSHEKLQKLVDAMAAAADYSFNKSHSCSYAIIAMQDMYLKHYYPADYAAAFLSRTKNEEKKGKAGHKTGENKIEKYVKMAIIEMDLNIAPPDVSISGVDWIPKDDKTIIPSLTFIKGVGEAAVPQIVKHQPYATLESFFECDMDWRLVNKRVVEALIQTGSFNNLYPYRKTLLEVYTKWNAAGKKNFSKILEKVENEMGQVDIDFDEGMIIEKELFGFYFSANPLDKYKEIVKEREIKEVSDLAKGKKWKKGTLYGIITKAFPYKIAKGNMCFVDIQGKDETKANITVWPEIYEQYKDIIKEGNVVAIKVKPGKGKNDEPCFYVDESDERKKVILMEQLLKIKSKQR
ncbi:MAG: polymerase alpha subunit [Sedimentibacter sp.]|jgi:DNA polymerase-3 subunit alpha|nr:polymerase alpha subunit [Sedimentibacter sp.]